MTSMKVKLAVVFGGSLLHTYPQSFVAHCQDAIGGTAYITKLEKVELTDGEILQESSLENG